MTRGFYYLAVVLALCITLPFRVRAGASVALSDLVAFPAGLCLLFEALRSPSVRARFSQLYRANPVVFAYALWTVVAAIVGLARGSDVLKIVHDLVPAFVLYALIGLTIDRPSRSRALVTACLIGLACHIVLALVQERFGGPFLTPTSPGMDAKLDVSGDLVTTNVVGLFPHPNGLAMFLIAPALFALALLPALTGGRRAALGAALVLVLFVLYRTQGKGAFAFLGVGTILLVMPRRIDRYRIVAGVGLALAAIVAIMWFSVTHFLDGQAVYGTLITRLELWNHAIEIIATDPFTCVFGSGYPLFGVTVVGSFEYPNAHNAWLNHVLSFGLPGLGLYLGCFVMGMRLACRKLVQTDGARRAALLACFAALAALFGEYFFEPADRGEVYTGQLFLLLALTAVLPRAADAP
jgi:O-antigen ligase